MDYRRGWNLWVHPVWNAFLSNRDYYYYLMAKSALQNQSAMVRKGGTENATATVTRQPQALTATPAQQFGNAGIGGNGISNVFKLFGVEECPECKSPLDLTDNRPLKEFCGHVRCRRCLMKGTACTQCKESLSVMKSDSQNGSAPHGHQVRQYSRKSNKRPVPQLQTPLLKSTAPALTASSSSSVTYSLPSTSAATYKPSHFPATLAKVSKLSNGHSPNASVLSISPATKHPDNKTNSHNGSAVNGYHQQQQHLQYNRKRPAEPETPYFTLASLATSPDLTTLSLPSTSAASFPRSSLPVTPSKVSKQINGHASATGSSTASLPDSSGGEEAASSSSQQSKEKKKKKRNPVIIHDHITVISGATTMFQCNVCMKKFKTKAHIKYHEFCQNGEKPFKCEQCGQGFIAKSHYEYHLRTHTGERPYVCPKCGKGFNQRGKVTRHMRSHTGEKPFVCTECGRGFANAQALRSHNLIHTGERPYACKYCNKRFTGMTNLKKHIITHTGERPYVCTHCNKSFGLKWTLDLHLRTHSSERPYACDQCERAFSNSKDLRRHLVIHSGERPFKCWICGTAFRRKDNLDRHIKNTHNQPKEVAKQLANEAAAEYLATNANSPVPASKVNSAVISKVIRTAQLNAPVPTTRTSRSLKTAKKSKPKPKSRPQPAPTAASSSSATSSSAAAKTVFITASLSPSPSNMESKESKESFENYIVPEPEDSFLLACTETEADSKIPEQSRNLIPSDCGIRLFVMNMDKEHSNTEDSSPNLSEVALPEELGGKLEISSNQMDNNTKAHSKIGEIPEFSLYGIFETESSPSLEENPELESDNVQENEEPMSTTEENVKIEILETESSPSLEENPEFESDNVQKNEEPMSTTEENVEIEILETEHSPSLQENPECEPDAVQVNEKTMSTTDENVEMLDTEHSPSLQENPECEPDAVQVNEKTMSTTDENVEILDTENTHSLEEKPDFKSDNLQTVNVEPMSTVKDNIEIPSPAFYEENGNFESDEPELIPTDEKKTQTVSDEEMDTYKEHSNTEDSSPNLFEASLPEQLDVKLDISSKPLDNENKPPQSATGENPEFSSSDILETGTTLASGKPKFSFSEILETSENSTSLEENPEFESDKVQANVEPESTTDEKTVNVEPMSTVKDNIEIPSPAFYEENGNFESDEPELIPTDEKETQTLSDEEMDTYKVLIGRARSIRHCNEPSSPVLSTAMDMASSTVTSMEDFEPAAVRSSEEGLQFSYETGMASEYTGTALYPTQLTIDQPNFYENMNIVYATATAQAERNDDESGPPVKIRLLHAEALGMRRDEPSDPRLYYAATRPNQLIEDYTSANVALAPPVVIHPPETDGATPYVSMYQYGYDQNISISQMPPSQYPVEVSYANGYTHAQQVSDHPDRTVLINRAREVRNFLPENHSYAHEWNAPASFEPPIYANHDPQQHQYMPGPMDQYNPNTTTTTTTRYSPLAELAAEASRRLSEANQEKYNATIAAAAAIAMVGEEARKKREQEYRANLNRQCDERIRIARENQLKSAAQRKSYY